MCGGRQHAVLELRNRRHDHFKRPDAIPQQGNRVAENGRHPADLSGAAARQDQQHRRIGLPSGRLVGIGTQLVQLLDQRDARHSCKAARRAGHGPAARTAATRAHDRHRLAWRGPGPAATPRPMATRNRRSVSTAPASRTRRAIRWVKSGLSMITSTSGRAATTAAATSRIYRIDRRQMRDQTKSDERNVAGRHQGLQPLAGHLAAADADQTQRTLRGFQGAHQRRAQAITGRLARRRCRW